MAPVAQRVCGVSSSGDVQKPSGHGPGQPVLSDLIEKGVGPDDLQRFRPFCHSMILWLEG